MMKASEALILGSTMLRPRPRTFDDNYGSGCAMGMINKAIGGDALTQIVLLKYPWMSDRQFPYPCGCRRANGPQGDYTPHSTANDIVIHLFDDHYGHPLNGPKLAKWTIEQIADWLGKVEPAEAPTYTEVTKGVLSEVTVLP